MYVYKYSVDVYLLCMIKVRVRWYTCSLRRILQPLVNCCCSVSPSSSSFLLTCIKTTTRNELARLGKGTIFLVQSDWCPYVYVRSCHPKKIVIERTRDLFYLKFVATDLFLKIISPSAGKNSGDLA